ncbi:class I SAM-dependent methyltransferase [Streptomyces sp. AK04-3B]|uniref:class I SAM-dependent methyltransferase n=1 Tax=Streptomyces sp. AK04-3B TaxID=3028650 RepID=UPI0039F5EC80
MPQVSASGIRQAYVPGIRQFVLLGVGMDSRLFRSTCLTALAVRGRHRRGPGTSRLRSCARSGPSGRCTV